ncbi:unnamed protein product [Phytophthora lilii]|uniref:Unnamed protein product n=1 Tax=Phytophthora lilii TaxID=2077276 RepID=A0A9W6TN99_9STRA|nr:unnamed protein product [Phytophthora lilii]
MPSSPSAKSRAVDDETFDAMPALRSPLPAGYFGDVQETEWKFFRRMGDLKVYQRRFRGRSRQEVAAEEDFPEAAVAVERGNPSMLADGGVSGSIEDMLYGMSATTQEEMLTGLSFTAPPQDAVLLSVVERSTVEDPLRSAELLWVLTKLPILNPRDVCYLKATGVGRDGKGKPYGYMVLHSVEMPGCPPFDYRKTKVLRAKMFFSFLFREVTPGYVNVMGRGIFDLAGGELFKMVLPHATASVIEGLLRGVSCGEAKKLTLNCKVKDKRMFAGTKQPCREVVCCQTCAQQAKALTGVRLGEPETIVVAEFYRNKLPSSSSSSSSRSGVATLSTPSLITSARHVEQDMAAHSYEAGKSEPTSMLSDAGKTNSSMDVTNSTVGDSCAGFDFDVSYSGTLSDLNSGPHRLSFNAYARDDDHLEEEPGSGPAVSAELLKEYAELDNPSPRSDSSGVKAWAGSYRVDAEDFTKPAAQTGAYDCGSSSKRRPNNMLEWMMELQSSAEEAYSTAKANEEIMKKSMR